MAVRIDLTISTKSFNFNALRRHGLCDGQRHNPPTKRQNKGVTQLSQSCDFYPAVAASPRDRFPLA